MITLQQARNNADRLHQEATQALAKSKLLKLLGRYGQVVAEGSFAYGLMVYRDIDLMVVNPSISAKQVLELAKHLLMSEHFRSANLYNYNDVKKDSNFFREGFPGDFYCGTRFYHNDEKWKVDIWLVKNQPGPENRAKTLEQFNWFDDKTQEEKDAMLFLKARLWEEGTYVHKGIGSFHVYRAVNEGIRGVEEFYKWMKDNYNYDRSKW